MFKLSGQTLIQAPLERCFLLSTSVDIVRIELRMTPIEGRTAGLVQGGDTVRWKGWKFGLPQTHVSLISAFEPFTYFQDSMIEGRFAHFQHDHWLRATPEGTVLEDEIRFALPFGPLGWVIGRLVLVPHIRKLLRRRYALLKRLAEGGEWRQYLPQQT